MNWRAVIIAVCVGCAAEAGAATRSGQVSGYRLTDWRTADGLPQNNVMALLQSQDGYLWIGTQMGLARFDGLVFTIFNRFNCPVLEGDSINALAEEDSGRMWVGTPAGLIEWQAGVARRYSRAEGLPQSTVDQVLPCRGGGVWWRCGTQAGWFQDGRFSRLGPDEGTESNALRRLAPRGRGELIIIGSHGVQHLERPGAVLSPLVPWPVPMPKAWSWAEDAMGRWWCASTEGIFVLRDGRWQKFESAGAFRGRDFSYISFDRAGGMWCASPDGGLERWHEGSVVSFPVGLAPHQNPVTRLLEDAEGNVWVGLANDGLVRLCPQRIKTWTTTDGLPDNEVWSVTAGLNGTVWAGTRNGLACLSNRTVINWPRPSKAPQGKLRSLWQDRTGVVWISHPGYAIYRLEQGRFQEVKEAALPDTGVDAFHEDRRGRLWIGSQRSVVVHENGRFTGVLGPEVLEQSARAVLADRTGGLWVGTYGKGVVHLDGTRTNVLTTADGLCDNRVWAFHEDAEGAIWMATENGLNRWKARRLASITTRHGLHENLINQILADDKGNFWFSGLAGVYRVNRSQLDAVADGRTNHVHCIAYGEADGMINPETNGEFQPCGARTADGHLWFPTMGGVIEINPAAISDNTVRPPVVIERVQVDERTEYDNAARTVGTPASPAARPRLDLAPGRARLMEIQFTANSFVAPEKVRFRYKLEPQDRDWSPPVARRVAFYTNLRPGDYTFRVRACNNHGYWNEAGDVFTFRLRPHFWQTWPFYALCGLLLVGGIAAIQAVRLTGQRRLLQVEQAAALDRERARIAQDMHDDLGASLSEIAILSEVVRRDTADPGRAMAGLDRISAKARGVVDSISELVWATNPRNDSLDNLAAYLRAYAAQYFEPTAIRCRFDFPASVPPLPITSEIRRAVFLVLKEALHNLVKHSGATAAEVMFALETNQLHLRITDNGRGVPGFGGDFRTPAPAPLPRRGGNGLPNIRRRIRALGGSFDLQSDPSQGTRLSVSIPISGPQRTCAR